MGRYKFRPYLSATQKIQKYSEWQGLCLLWTGPKFKSGYGSLHLYGRNLKAHRVQYALMKGPVTGFFVCHSCDIPSCINPEHLFLGTPGDNMKDKCAKGRQWRPIGRRHWNYGGRRYFKTAFTSQTIEGVRE